MSLGLLDARAGDCCREHELSASLAGALPEEAQARLDAHLAECERCEERLARMAEETEAFAAARPWPAMARALESRAAAARPPWWQRLLARPAWLGVPLAAAAAVTLLVLLPGGDPEVEPSVRPKGRVALSFVVERDGRAVPGDPEATYHAGDRLQLGYSTPEHVGLVIVGRDGTGAVSTWYDRDGWSVPIRPGDGRLLEGSVILDAAPGPERVVACFSSRPVRTQDVIAAVWANRPLPEACQAVTLSIRKAR